MKNSVKLVLILLFITNIYLPLRPEERFDVKINKEGWNLPKLDMFILTWDKHACGEPFKNCYEECYKSKEKITIPRTVIIKTIYKEIPSVEIYSIEFVIDGLTIYYYKNMPFCYFYGGKQGCYVSFLIVLDMDLDGKYELMLDIPEAKKFFLKYSSKVDEDDRYKGPIYIGGKEIE